MAKAFQASAPKAPSVHAVSAKIEPASLEFLWKAELYNPIKPHAIIKNLKIDHIYYKISTIAELEVANTKHRGQKNRVV